MKIYFIRHGQTEYNKNNYLTGQTDTVLTEEGIQQTKNIITQIPFGCSLIYCSDLFRCKQTVTILNNKLNLPIIYDTRLKDINFGSLEGMCINDISPELHEQHKIQQYDYRPYGGESIQDVKDRVISFIKEIKKIEKDIILVITSGSIIKLVYNILNKEVHKKIYNNSIHEFEFSDLN